MVPPRDTVPRFVGDTLRSTRRCGGSWCDAVLADFCHQVYCLDHRTYRSHGCTAPDQENVIADGKVRCLGTPGAVSSRLLGGGKARLVFFVCPQVPLW